MPIIQALLSICKYFEMLGSAAADHCRCCARGLHAQVLCNLQVQEALCSAAGSLQCRRLSAVQERERALRLWLLQMHLHSAASKSSPPTLSAESNTFHSAPQFETFSAI